MLLNNTDLLFPSTNFALYKKNNCKYKDLKNTWIVSKGGRNDEMKDHVFNVLKIYSLFTIHKLRIKGKKKRCKKNKNSQRSKETRRLFQWLKRYFLNMMRYLFNF